ncbi:MAG: hypothetical protein QW835_02580 [Candidatus Hadarchaeum sp.]
MKLPKVHDFNRCLEEGLLWEARLRPFVEKLLIGKILHSVSFNERPDLQKSGIDMILQKEAPSVEIKIRDHKYYAQKDILLETVSVAEERTEGWAYLTKADLIFYIWKTPAGTNLADGYIILIQKLKDWLKQNEHKFKKKIACSVRDGKIWHTENVAVPIAEFPDGTLYRFSPHLTAEEQTQLKSFLKPEEILEIPEVEPIEIEEIPKIEAIEPEVKIEPIVIEELDVPEIKILCIDCGAELVSDPKTRVLVCPKCRKP